MPVPHLRMSIPSLSNNLLSPPFGFATVPPNYRISFMKNIYPSFVSNISSRAVSDIRACQVSIDTRETCDIREGFEQILVADLSEDRTSTEEIQLNGYSHSAVSLSDKDYKEMERRRKIGLANKGNLPWNKGKAHSAETRERIRRRTKEALRDPKIRKKMSECPRNHSNQTKARIRSSLRRVWGRRMKSRRSREKFMQSWAESIANAAKKGGNDQEGLDWDSYDKIKKDIAFQQLQHAVEKANAKEMIRLRAETKAAKMEIARLRVLRAAETKAAKMANVAQKKKERDEKAKVKGEEVKRKKRVPRKSKEEQEEFAVAREFNLKENLMKIHKKISVNGEFRNNGNRAWEKLDLEFIRNGHMPKEVSLADQILAAKQKRAGIISNKAVVGLVE